MRLILSWIAFALSLVIVGSISIPVSAQNKALLLFGGRDHKTLLGCLNCSDISATSVCNEIGKYGSDISPLSPWNDISQDGPIIVDEDGRSYGYFTTNDIRRDRTRINWAVAILDYFVKVKDLAKARKAFCK